MNKLMQVFLIISLALVHGCSPSEDVAHKTISEESWDRGTLRLARDMRLLQSFSLELKDLAEEMEILQTEIQQKERGHYTSDEHDKIENLLFRYLVCRESLWEMIDYYRDYNDRFSDEQNRTKGFTIGFDAALHLANYSSILVATFIDNDIIIDKLNEEYYRSGIPRGTFNKLFESLTNIENIEALKTAWELYSTEIADHESLLYKISQSEPAYKHATSQLTVLYKDVDERIRHILEKRSLLLPDVRNRLRHSKIIELAQEARVMLGDNLYAARGILFQNISRIKSPTAVNLEFSKEQVARMKELLKPGDLILTFSDGYMSNVFLPGKFKHGITYVGSPEDREKAGLFEEPDQGVPEQKIEKFKTDLKIDRLDSGKEADLIEAVAEGVIFNSLEEIANEHIARLCVLRPHLNRNNSINSLRRIFLLLGNSYDFKFDFTDGSSQCCTELIYRAFHKQGPIRFDLTKRMGVWTLCADDIVQYYLSSKQGVFDFVLYAEESPGADGKAHIQTGDEGERLLSLLMGSN